MKFLSSDSFLTSLWALGLAIVLSISPLQNVSASLSTDKMKSGMHHKMNHSTHKAQTNNKTNNSQDDCCQKAQCKSIHCTGTLFAVLTSNTAVDNTYYDSTIVKTPHVSLTHFYSPSLYRPPKF